MTKEVQVPRAELSRRKLLASAAYVATAVPVLCTATAVMPTRAVAQAKVTKSAVAYQETPKGDQECTNCNLFQPPNACKNVAGDISPKAWCNIWVKK